MNGPMICLVIPLGSGHGIWGGPPMYPDQGLPAQPPGYWGGVAPPYPDQGLPGGQGGRPSQPIYHPGHPDHGLPAYPDQGLPGGSGGHPAHPIHIPGVPDQGLPEPTPVPPDQVTDPEIPAEFNDDLVIAVKQPGSEEWTYSAYTVQPDQGQPQPTPQQGGRRR